MINWGELSKYIPTDLLDKTNIDKFISQEEVDEFNEVLVSKNPNFRGAKYREWDYALFDTKSGNEFMSHSISLPFFGSTGADEREAILYFEKGYNYIIIKGVHQENYESISINDSANKLYYEIRNNKITYRNLGGLFTISGVELPQETTTNR